METKSKKLETDVAFTIKIIKYVRNENKYRTFNNENCLRLIFKAFSRAFLKFGGKMQEPFIFATAYQTQALP